MFFAFIMMGPFGKAGRAIIKEENAVIGVSSIDEAVKEAKELQRQGVKAIELCGAFGPDGAKAVIKATGGQVPVGYVTHLREQDVLYNRIFGDPIRED